MRVRAVAMGILVFAGIDLVVLAIAPLLGWIELGPAASTWSVAALALAFFLALLAMIGSVSVLATDFPEPADHYHWDPSCSECGRAPRLDLRFCHHCGASA